MKGRREDGEGRWWKGEKGEEHQIREKLWEGGRDGEREGWRKYNPDLEEGELLTSDLSTLSPVSMQAKIEYLSGILAWIES